MRECKVCKVSKDASGFTARRRVCKPCYASAVRGDTARREYGKQYREANKDKERARSKSYYQDNTAKVLANQAAYYQNNRVAAIARGNEYAKRRQKVDPGYKLARLLRIRLRGAVKGVPHPSLMAVLGCNIEELRAHLESKFQIGMTWDNHGAWHLDHIQPLASFDLTDSTQYATAAHFTNLQPLWAVDNLRKGSKILVDD